MIRLIQRRLIIPQGDTGTFTIPTQGTVEADTYAVLAIYDPLTHTTVLEKTIAATPETLEFQFERKDTINIEPSKRYLWDITIYRGCTYDDENKKIIHADSADSYYAAFKLPTCEIRTVTPDVQKQS